MPEMVIGTVFGRKLVAAYGITGPASYASPGFEVTISSLNTVERVLSVRNNGGYITDPDDITLVESNKVRIKVRTPANALSHTGTAVADHARGGTCPATGATPETHSLAALGHTVTQPSPHAAAPANEVADGVNLSGVVFSLEVVGI